VEIGGENLKKMISDNPFHTSIGVALIMIGTFLMRRDNYFRWPPGISVLANDDVVGFLLLLFGAGYLFWVFDTEQSARLNHFLLSGSAGLMALLTVYQLLHFLIVGNDMPWISNGLITAIIMILAARSDSRDHDDHD